MSALETKIDDFLAQKRIAVVGVSRDKGRHPVGSLIFHRLKDSGHDVFAVNPHIGSFEGEPCYPDVKSIPGGVDAAMIITRPEVTEQVVRECDEARIRRVWMHQSMAGGSSVSPTAVQYCREHDISAIAGACPMMFGEHVDFGHQCMKWMMGATGGLPT